ncbi:MAG: ankyrin repeat domain-containing protein [Candidatus Acidiferrum sp.]|jgi:ankyrin repeat protein
MSTAELFEAIRAGNSAAVSALLDSEASLVSAKNESGVSAVLMCVYTGRREIRDLLLSRGATLQLQEAAAVGDLDRVKQFVEKDPSVARSVSPDGFPVVALAAVFGHLEVARYLAAQGADVDAPATNGSGYNALTGAIASGHTEIVKWLLETGASANYRYGPGYSPLLTAAANGHLEIVKVLLAHGADLRAVSNDGKSALTLATERNHPAVADHLHSVAV